MHANQLDSCDTDKCLLHLEHLLLAESDCFEYVTMLFENTRMSFSNKRPLHVQAANTYRRRLEDVLKIPWKGKLR